MATLSAISQGPARTSLKNQSSTARATDMRRRTVIMLTAGAAVGCPPAAVGPRVKEAEVTEETPEQNGCQRALPSFKQEGCNVSFTGEVNPPVELPVGWTPRRHLDQDGDQLTSLRWAARRTGAHIWE